MKETPQEYALRKAENAARQAENVKKYEFDNWVTTLTPQSIVTHKPSSAPLPERYPSISAYYEQFKQAIKDEVIAILKQTLEGDAKETPQAILTLVSVKEPKVPGTATQLILAGHLPQDTDSGSSYLALLLELNGVQYIALANIREEGEIFAKVMLLKTISGEFKNQNKKVYLLASLVNQARMYRTCVNQPAPPFLSKILQSRPEPQTVLLQSRPEPQTASALSTLWERLTLSSFLPKIFQSQPEPQTVSTLPLPTLLGGDLTLSPKRLQSRPEAKTASHLTTLSGALPLQLPETKTGLSARLNRSQNDAMTKFIAIRNDVLLLQGPPGTGKTMMITALLDQLLQNTRERIMVCAPSNKAVQVLARRLLRHYSENRILLIGADKNIPEDLSIITLSRKIETIIDSACKIRSFLYALLGDDPITGKTKIIEKHFLIAQKTLAQAEIKLLLKYLSISVAPWFTSKKEAVARLSIALNEVNVDNIESLYPNLGKLQSVLNASQMEESLLNDARLIFCTLSTSGRPALQAIPKINTLIIDEAGQAIEPETFIPFCFNPDRCLLVGDTKQLPPTVTSEQAKINHLGWSMFWRLIEECKMPHEMLTTQYRMHAEIRSWPSQQFYENRIRDASEIESREPLLVPPVLSPYAFIDVSSQERLTLEKSYENLAEAKTIEKIIKFFQKHHIDVEKQVGIITFYSGQVEAIEKLLKGKYGRIRVHTVDSFQGDECEIIIMSFVRANPRGRTGFLSDFRRLNVAITRAQKSLIMLGDVRTLSTYQDSNVAALIKNAEDRNVLFSEAHLLSIIQPPQPKKTKVKIKPKIEIKALESQGLICRFYKKDIPKSCRKGDQCDFKHPQHTPTTTKKQMASSLEKADPIVIHPVQPTPTPSSTYKTELCRFFNFKKSCHKGQNCTYAHGEKELRPHG